jgi:intracellular multiplication protein IcmL
MKVDRLQLVKLRNSFYKDGFRRMSFMLLLSLIINLILMTSLLITHNKENRPIYFAAAADGSLKKLSPVKDAVYNTEQVQDWIAQKIPSILHLNFMDYKDQLLNSKKYFTPDGWSNFNSAFTPMIKQLKDKRLLTSAIIPHTPVVTSQIMLAGHYSWYVDVPVNITFESQDGSYTTNQYVWRVLVSRVDNRTNNQMLGIRQVVAQSMGK